MELKELEELKGFNELDLLFRLIEKVDGVKKRTEQVVKNNKSAGVDVRKAMQDIRLISEIIRDQVQNRKFNTQKEENSKLFKAIEAEKKRIAREEARIKKLEQNRIVQR